jgi:hypothetical protein
MEIKKAGLFLTQPIYVTKENAAQTVYNMPTGLLLFFKEYQSMSIG